ALLVQVSLGGKKPQGIQEAKVEILVAAKDLATGAQLKGGEMRWQEWPKSSVFPGAVIREKDQAAESALKGRLARNISKGEPIVKTALVGESKGNFIAGALEPGMRAVAIDVKAAEMVGGFIGPGDFVDVILTYKASVKPEDEDPRVKNMVEQTIQKMATETILQNVKVLAVDQAAKRPEDDKIKVGKTVTLAMTSEQSEKIALASGMGDLVLSLRGVGDDKIVTKDWKTVSDARLVTIDDDVFTEYKKMKKGAGNNSDSMRIYNGSSVNLVPAP
ncbi:MAG: Flp pilus assembly protein CpaB, partial [Alphaproteobacteria bacterium]